MKEMYIFVFNKYFKVITLNMHTHTPKKYLFFFVLNINKLYLERVLSRIFFSMIVCTYITVHVFWFFVDLKLKYSYFYMTQSSYLGADLVAALAGLQVNYFPHAGDN